MDEITNNEIIETVLITIGIVIIALLFARIVGVF